MRTDGGAAGHADRESGEEHQRDWDARMGAEEVGGDERRQADHRPDREIDVARQDDHRLAQREQGEDRRVHQDELDVREVDEARLDARGHDHEQCQHRDDSELAHAEDEVYEPPGIVGDDGSRRRAGVGRRSHVAAASSWPVAAATIVSSDASACANSATILPSRITRMRSASRAPRAARTRSSAWPRPSAASSLEQPVHLRLRADVDAARGLVDDQELGRRASHFASTTFCWLPPESDATGS